MSILIPGKMPANGEVIVIRPNGQATLYASGDVAFLEDPKRVYKTVYKTIELPHHGRLIDADALADKYISEIPDMIFALKDKRNVPAFVSQMIALLGDIAEADTIIPAEEGDDR